MSSSSWQMWQSTALMHLVGGRPFASFLIDFAENFLSNTTMSLYLFTLFSSHIPLFSVHFLLDLVDKSVLHCAWLWYSIFVDIFHFRSEPMWDGFPLCNGGLMIQWKCSSMPSRGVGIPLSNSGLKILCTSLIHWYISIDFGSLILFQGKLKLGDHRVVVVEFLTAYRKHELPAM